MKTRKPERRPPVIAILGTTASGKNQLGARVAEKVGGTVLSLDATKVFKGMDIGSAKPDAALRALAPHELIDLVEPNETFSTGRYVEAAKQALERSDAEGRAPVFTGGTSLYWWALVDGFFEGPEADWDWRNELRSRGDREGWHVLHAELAAIDPRAAKRIHQNDHRRLERALEVPHLTGKTISDLQKQSPSLLTGRRIVAARIDVPRRILHDRITERVQQMFRDGLIDEVRGLLARYGTLSKQAGQAIGYREVIAWLATLEPGRTEAHDIAPLVAEIDIHTRQFAKRQETWLKRFPAALKLHRDNARDPDGTELRVAIDRVAAAWDDVQTSNEP